MRTIILASASPRRKELLTAIGLRFTIDASNGDEHLDPSLTPRRLARSLSLEKALAAAPKHRDAVVIAADTIVILDDRVLGKPRSRAEGRRMLGMLSGREHTVITAYTVLDTKTGRRKTRAVSTRVRFRTLSRQTIEQYLDSGEPFDKAGAYGIQGMGSLLVKGITGDFFTVMGLPVGDLVETLKEFGVEVLL
jgi:septum formation protein